jgi:calcineurin-like phosphoesterase family protein
MKRIATLGDPHACYEEIAELLQVLSWLGLDEIWSLGDNIHRGPDNEKTIQLLRRWGVRSIKGNHEQTHEISQEAYDKRQVLPKNEDKSRAILELSPESNEWLRNLPRMHVDDELGLVLVHGGLWPGVAFHDQPDNIIRAQMIHMDHLVVNKKTGRLDGHCRWWGKDAIKQKHGFTEEQSAADGWFRWYKRWDHPYRVAVGHSVFAKPTVLKSEIKNAGYIVACDTGGCFGGLQTAAIFEDDKPPQFISVRPKKQYFQTRDVEDMD